MSESFYSAEVEDVKGWIDGSGEFLEPGRLLGDLTEEQAMMVPPGSPYSVSQIVAHLNYWQGGRFARLRGEPWEEAHHLSDTFRQIEPGAWENLRAGFLRDLESIKRLAEEKQEYGYVDRSLHNAYHFGQISMVRHLLELWPPAGGEDYDF